MYIHSRDGAPPGPRSDEPETEQQQTFSASPVATHTPIAPISSAKHHRRHYDLIAWIVRTLSVLIFTAPSPSTISPPLSKRSPSPNATTSIVAGVLVSAFVICVGVFFCFYGRSIRVRRRRHRHRHRRRTSKVSQNSDAPAAVAGGGDGGGEPVAEA
ncbi:hypothetical protein F4861DRAFT_180568 [Xylaria intraflava]|nr:hypothetical protein F4861DRAFT_180568 [Xylaria intraflava]